MLFFGMLKNVPATERKGIATSKLLYKKKEQQLEKFFNFFGI